MLFAFFTFYIFHIFCELFLSTILIELQPWVQFTFLSVKVPLRVYTCYYMCVCMNVQNSIALVLYT